MKLKQRIYYTKIYHDLKNKLNLTYGEYIVIDIIRILSKDPKYKYKCIYTNNELSDRSSESISTVQRALKKGRDLKLLETGYKWKRITKLWEGLERSSEKSKSKYVIISHDFKKKFQLTNLDYVIIDAVDNLSSGRKYGFRCVLSYEKIGEILSISANRVSKAVKSAKEHGYIQGDYRKIKTTHLWGKIKDINFSQKKQKDNELWNKKNILKSF